MNAPDDGLRKLDRQHLEELVNELRGTRLELLSSLEELREIQSLARTIRSTSDLSQILAGLRLIVSRVLPVPELGLYLSSSQMASQDVFPNPPALDEVYASLVEEGIVDWVIDEGRATVIPDPEDQNPDLSDVLVPLLVMGQELGMMLVQSPIEKEQVTAQMLDLLSFAAGQAATAIENFRLLEEVRQGRKYLQVMLDTAAELILVINADGRISYANERLARYGLTRSKVLGRRLQTLVRNPEDRQALDQRLHESRAGMLELRLGVAGPDRPRRLVQLNLSPMPSMGGGSPRDWMVLVHDETERRELEARVREAEKYQAVMHAAVAVNHEINNPLTAVLGNLFMLRRDLGPDAAPAQLNRIAVAEENCRRIQDVTSRLEKLSEIKLVTYLGNTEMLDLGAAAQPGNASSPMGPDRGRESRARNLPPDKKGVRG
ncbi:MAG: PAS domain-containing protein [Candidatus Cloacimonetes bacterium]|nr:PAS domain-containing protein [Candidatus Cloacimonadota bacterium]